MLHLSMYSFLFVFRNLLLGSILLCFTIISCKHPGTHEGIDIPDIAFNELRDEAGIKTSNSPKEDTDSPKNEVSAMPNQSQNTESIPKKEVVEKIEEQEKLVEKNTLSREALTKYIKAKAAELTNDLFSIYEALSPERQSKFDEMPREEVQGSLTFLLTHGFLGLNLKAQELFDTLEKYYTSPCSNSWHNWFSCTKVSIKWAYIQAYRSATTEEIAKLKK